MSRVVNPWRWLAIGLAGAFLGGAPAAWDAGLTRFKAGGASDDVISAMKEARAMALTRGQPVKVRVDEGLRSVWVEGGSWHKLPEGVSMAGPPRSRDGEGAITFLPDGSSSGGQVVVSWRGRAISVLVGSQDGRVRRVAAGQG
jgi:hypothetical protein